MKTTVITLANQPAGEVELPEALFGAEPRAEGVVTDLAT